MDEPENDGNWVKARSSLVWIAALVVAFASVWWIEKQTRLELIAKTAPAQAQAQAMASADLPPQPAPRPLTVPEVEAASSAWAATEREAAPATAWDAGSALVAVISARRLELLQEAAFDQRVTLALATLPTPQDATDAARLLVPLHVLAWRYPKHADAAGGVVAKWDLPQLAAQGARPGWGPYTSRALALMGQDMRTQEAGTADAWLLAGLEFGLTGTSRDMAWRAWKQDTARGGPSAIAGQALFGVSPSGAAAAGASNLSNHAVVLESLAFIAHGRLLAPR
ncbi:DUF3131 domain-containing protein [Ramlibacter humi]|uniref:DUF3131 domain-containing protein n=1 Tax=Ramlibacter humi TaxID=2530451 RepID=A0A4Z0BE99_9BURK|nr:DUF3131 domain-containing protein [Ramlibacter humi]TFY96709.1 DUF3131 domain-containing protein [Ramlibacter humi]